MINQLFLADLTVLLSKFAEQTFAIIVIGFVLWKLYDLYKEEKKQRIADQEAHKLELQKLNDSKALDFKNFLEALHTIDKTMNTLLYAIEELNENTKALKNERN